jgi:hypothetical protein
MVYGNKVFDLEKIVSVSSIYVNWADDESFCQGQLNVSSDGINWTVKKDWSNVTTPSSFALSNLGNLRYIQILKKGCGQSGEAINISAMMVAGTY